MSPRTSKHVENHAPRHAHGPWCDYGAQCHVIELSPVAVVSLAHLLLPPGAVVFSEGHHRHTCWVCGDLLADCACDLRNRIDFCTPCYQAMCEDWERGSTL